MPIRQEQKIIVKWMRCQLDRLEWLPERWAREAGLAPTTVTRAMSDNYGSVSSVTTLNALARAAGIPSVIDFLDGQASLEVRDYPVVASTLERVLPELGCDLSSEDVSRLSAIIGAAITGIANRESGKH